MYVCMYVFMYIYMYVSMLMSYQSRRLRAVEIS